MSAADQPGTSYPLGQYLENLRHELDRWLESARSGKGQVFGEGSGAAAVDIVERPEDVLIRVDVPGVPHDAIEVSITGNMLSVKGSYPETVLGEGERAHLSERPRGPFNRSIPLPASVEGENVQAELHGGILTITVAKNAPKSRTVPISVPSKQDSDAVASGPAAAGAATADPTSGEG
ncbi:Spore protein SP21 [Maioricimonas rarisocia]|uniref:Spore protein SP21 n=1 Tax=Maioricimonas rarisocia TaxID=2528026 RepID=A0A517Z9Z7_9PLAN|nr:Hsp20/alpha crystallin family protein [Maioricimonas rarisocia]QDU39315.1 Spore protein SP21 [Maioricimonas rarisocia]